MELRGVTNGNTIVLSGPPAVPDGTEVIVRIEPAVDRVADPPPPPGLRPDGTPMTFGDYFGDLRGAAVGLPEDLAAQHDHYRLGTPKR